MRDVAGQRMSNEKNDRFFLSRCVNNRESSLVIILDNDTATECVEKKHEYQKRFSTFWLN